MLRVALTVERFSPMMSSFSLTSPGKKLTAVAFVCAVLGGLSGCDNQSVLNDNTSASWSSSSQRNPDHIYANHTEGADPDGGLGGFKSAQEYDDYKALSKKWGVKQTPDWLAICNQVNVSALRKVGFDPQKDLENRRGGTHKTNCYWSRNKDELQFFFGTTDSAERIKANPKFRYSTTVNRGKETYYMGDIQFLGEGTTVNQYSCSVTYERNGQAYMAAFTGKEPKTHDEACNELIDMVSPRN